MQHLEGGPWTFLTIVRYNSWDDFATGEKNSVAQTTKKDGPWSRLRDHTDFHTDTLHRPYFAVIAASWESVKRLAGRLVTRLSLSSRD